MTDGNSIPSALRATLDLFVTPDFQSKIAGTNSITRRFSGRRIGKNNLDIFALRVLMNDPQIVSQKSSKFVTPCFVAAISTPSLRASGAWEPNSLTVWAASVQPCPTQFETRQHKLTLHDAEYRNAQTWITHCASQDEPFAEGSS